MAGLTIIDSFERDERRDRNECCSFSTQERAGEEGGGEPLVVWCRFPFVKHMSILQSQQRRGGWENYSCKEKDEGGEGGWEGRGEEKEGGIDLTLGESHHSSVHFHSSGLVMGVLIWQVGGRGQEGDLGG